MADRKELESFIGTSFRSVWAIEVLQYLVDRPGTYFSAEELISALRASDGVVSQSVANLVAAGLALTDEQGRVACHEGPGQQGALARAAIELYRRSPDKVRRLIIAQSAPGVTAFAKAFKLRED